MVQNKDVFCMEADINKSLRILRDTFVIGRWN